MEEIMTPEQLKEYIREMPENEVLRIRFGEDEEGGRDNDSSDGRDI